MVLMHVFRLIHKQCVLVTAESVTKINNFSFLHVYSLFFSVTKHATVNAFCYAWTCIVLSRLTFFCSV